MFHNKFIGHYSRSTQITLRAILKVTMMQTFMRSIMIPLWRWRMHLHKKFDILSALSKYSWNLSINNWCSLASHSLVLSLSFNIVISSLKSWLLLLYNCLFPLVKSLFHPILSLNFCSTDFVADWLAFN